MLAEPTIPRPPLVVHDAVVSDRDVGWLFPAARAVLTPVFRFSWQLHVEGLEHVPSSGGALICPNHTSVLDSFFVPLVLPRQITYVGKAEYLDDWKTKYLFPAMGMIPIDRAGGSASERALSAAQRIIEGGGLFGIYPEGTREPRRPPVPRPHRPGPPGAAHRRAARPGRHPRRPRGLAARPPTVPHPWRPVRLSLRPTDRDEALRRPRRRPHAAAPDHRRAHVRDPRAVGSALRGRVRHEEEARRPSRRSPMRASVPPSGAGRRREPAGTATGHRRQRHVSLREYAELDDPTAPRSSADVLRRESGLNRR